MRRPVLVMTIFYMIGTLFQYYMVLSYKMIILGFFVGMIFGMSCFLKKGSMTGVLLVVLLVAGILNFKINYEYEGEFSSFYDENIYVTGDVYDCSYKDRMKYSLKVEEIYFEGRKYRVEDRLIVYIEGDDKRLGNVIGKRVRVQGVLVKPKERRNPKLFDYDFYLKTKKIHGLIYSKMDQFEILGEGNIGYTKRWANITKTKVVYIIKNALPKREGEILRGILLGDKDALDQDIYDDFRKAGIAHVLAVSGLHVGFLYAFLNKILKGFHEQIRIPILLVILSFYGMVTGCEPSVIRALSMTSLFIIGPVINRRYDSLSAIGVIGFILLIINPLLLFYVGFQLSFVAVLSIVILYPVISKKMGGNADFLSQMIGVSIAAQIGIIPVVAYHFNYISLGGFFINIPIVLIVSYVVPLGLLMVILGFLSMSLAAMVGTMIYYLIKIMLILSDFISAIPFGSCSLISPSYFFILLYYGLLFIFIREDKIFLDYGFSKKRIIGMILGIAVLCQGIIYAMPHPLKVVFLDVGQGDCIFIKTPMGKNLLIDGGGNDPNLSNKIDVGKEILVPYLLKNHVRKIDMMILTHIHRDHMGGLLSVLDDLKVNTLIMGTDFFESEDIRRMKEKAFDKKIKIYKLLKGDKIEVEENINLHILHPGKKLIESSRDDVNNNSLVVLLEYRGQNLLFTGDIEKEGEERIMKNYPDLHVGVLKVAHHGSVYSSHDAFIESLKPKIAIIQVGKNHFGHPHDRVLNTLKKQGTATFRNDKNGAIIVTLYNDKMKIKTMIK